MRVYPVVQSCHPWMDWDCGDVCLAVEREKAGELMLHVYLGSFGPPSSLLLSIITNNLLHSASVVILTSQLSIPVAFNKQWLPLLKSLAALRS